MAYGDGPTGGTARRSAFQHRDGGRGRAGEAAARSLSQRQTALRHVTVLRLASA
jgi:hypothetical protein